MISKESALIILADLGLKFKVPNLLENIAFEIFINGTYESQLVRYIVKNAPRNGVFFDIGANIGAISLFVAKLRPDITIYAIEASPRVFGYLEENVKINRLQNIHLYNIAIDIVNGERRAFYSPVDKFGKGSFSSVFTHQAEEVITARLDHIISMTQVPNLIKVDVEGYEKIVFQSMDVYLNPDTMLRPEIIFEFVDWAETAAFEDAGNAQQYLVDYGYELFDFDKLIAGKYSRMQVVNRGALNIVAKPSAQ